MLDRLVALLVAHEQGGSEPDHPGGGGVHDEPARQSLGHDRPRVQPVGEEGGEQEPAPSDPDDPLELAERGGEPPAPLPREAGRADRLHRCEGGPGRGEREGLAAEGAPVVTGDEDLRHLGACPAGADRNPVAEGLGEGDHVRGDPLLLEPEPPAGPGEAGLDLVEDEEDPRSSQSSRSPRR